jgi:hypothetical protein
VRDVQVQKQKKVSSELDLDLVLVSPLRRTLQTATGVPTPTIYLSPSYLPPGGCACSSVLHTRAHTRRPL